MTDTVLTLLVLAIGIGILMPLAEWFAPRITSLFRSTGKMVSAEVSPIAGDAWPVVMGHEHYPDPPVIIYGAGTLGRQLVELARSKSVDSEAREILEAIKPIGFIDDDPTKRNTKVGELPVLGGLAELEAILANKSSEEIQVGGIITAIARLDDAHQEQLKEICSKAKIHCCRFGHAFRRIV